MRRTFSRLNSLDGEKDFILPELARRREGLYLAWTRSTARRTFSCLNSLDGENDFLLPELAQRREGLSLAWTRSTARRTFSCLNSLNGEKDFLWCLNLPRVYISSPLDALRTFSLSRLHSLDDEEVFIFLASRRTRALRSLILTGASDRRKTMRTLKLCRRKAMGTLKLFLKKHAA